MATESYVLKVVEIVEETADAHSVRFEVPEDVAPLFEYTPGQFLTVAVPSDQTGLVARCYSLSSAPHTGEHQITVKRTEGGYASNWINDNLKASDTMRVLPPSGIFTPRDLDADLLLFAGGSGITPVMSIVRSALEKGSGKVVLFYANRDEQSVIFAQALADLSAEYAERLVVVHWLESVQGLPTQDQLQAFASYFSTYTAFVCGPAPFMKATRSAMSRRCRLQRAPWPTPTTTTRTTRRRSRVRSPSRWSWTDRTTPSTTGRATRCSWSSWRRRASTRRSPAVRATAAPARAWCSRARCG
jgi:3-ketosteroid 9alpha-monooxygenase subunit B